MNNNVPIAVIILNWNGAHILPKYLPFVIEYTPKDMAEIIVADNFSSDDSVALLEREYANEVRVIKLDRNYGFAEGYNRAIAQVDHPYVLLLNSDVRVTDGWLKPLYDFMQAAPDVVSVQPRIRSDRQPAGFEYAGAMGGYMDKLGYPFCRGRIFDMVESDQGQYSDAPKEVFWTTGAAMLVRRQAYQEVGGLESSFFAHQEEIDLAWRWQAQGRKLYVVPQSIVYHYGGASLSSENPRKTFLNFRNNLRMLYRNLPISHLIWTLIARFFLDVIAAVVFLLRRHWRDAWSVMRAWGAFLRGLPYRARGYNRSLAYRQLYPHCLLFRYHFYKEKVYSRLVDTKF